MSKHIALLAGGDGWHVRDLQRAAHEQGHRTGVVDFRKISAGVAGLRLPKSSETSEVCPADPPSGEGGYESLFDFDAIIVRTMPPGSLEQVVFRMDVLHRARAKGIPVLNPPLALETCIDKYLCSAKLEAAGLRVPPTVVCQDAETALQAFASLGKDVVVKPIFGSEGRGMLRVWEEELAWRTFRTLERTQAVIYLQQFIKHPGWDLRVFILGDTVLAGMKRHAKKDWRTNVAQGGVGEPVQVGKVEADLALRAAKATGLAVGGVDLLPGPGGEWYVLEVNAVPGWRALARVCRVDVAAEIIKTVVNW